MSTPSGSDNPHHGAESIQASAALSAPSVPAAAAAAAGENTTRQRRASSSLDFTEDQLRALFHRVAGDKGSVALDDLELLLQQTLSYAPSSEEVQTWVERLGLDPEQMTDLAQLQKALHNIDVMKEDPLGTAVGAAKKALWANRYKLAWKLTDPLLRELGFKKKSRVRIKHALPLIAKSMPVPRHLLHDGISMFRSAGKTVSDGVQRAAEGSKASLSLAKRQLGKASDKIKEQVSMDEFLALREKLINDPSSAITSPRPHKVIGSLWDHAQTKLEEFQRNRRDSRSRRHSRSSRRDSQGSNRGHRRSRSHSRAHLDDRPDGRLDLQHSAEHSDASDASRRTRRQVEHEVSEGESSESERSVIGVQSDNEMAASTRAKLRRRSSRPKRKGRRKRRTSFERWVASAADAGLEAAGTAAKAAKDAIVNAARGNKSDDHGSDTSPDMRSARRSPDAEQQAAGPFVHRNSSVSVASPAPVGPRSKAASTASKFQGVVSNIMGTLTGRKSGTHRRAFSKAASEVLQMSRSTSSEGGPSSKKWFDTSRDIQEEDVNDDGEEHGEKEISEEDLNRIASDAQSGRDAWFGRRRQGNDMDDVLPDLDEDEPGEYSDVEGETGADEDGGFMGAIGDTIGDRINETIGSAHRQWQGIQSSINDDMEQAVMLAISEFKRTMDDTSDKIERGLGQHAAATVHYMTDRVLTVIHICIVVVVVPIIVGTVFIALETPFAWPTNLYVFLGIWMALAGLVTCCFCMLYGVNDYSAIPEVSSGPPIMHPLPPDIIPAHAGYPYDDVFPANIDARSQVVLDPELDYFDGRAEHVADEVQAVAPQSQGIIRGDSFAARAARIAVHAANSMSPRTAGRARSLNTSRAASIDSEKQPSFADRSVRSIQSAVPNTEVNAPAAAAASVPNQLNRAGSSDHAASNSAPEKNIKPTPLDLDRLNSGSSLGGIQPLNAGPVHDHEPQAAVNVEDIQAQTPFSLPVHAAQASPMLRRMSPAAVEQLHYGDPRRSRRHARKDPGRRTSVLVPYPGRNAAYSADRNASPHISMYDPRQPPPLSSSRSMQGPPTRLNRASSYGTRPPPHVLQRPRLSRHGSLMMRQARVFSDGHAESAVAVRALRRQLQMERQRQAVLQQIITEQQIEAQSKAQKRRKAQAQEQEALLQKLIHIQARQQHELDRLTPSPNGQGVSAPTSPSMPQLSLQPDGVSGSAQASPPDVHASPPDVDASPMVPGSLPGGSSSNGGGGGDEMATEMSLVEPTQKPQARSAGSGRRPRRRVRLHVAR